MGTNIITISGTIDSVFKNIFVIFTPFFLLQLHLTLQKQEVSKAESSAYGSF